MKHRLFTIWVFTCLLGAAACNPDEDDAPPSSSGSGSNGNNNGGNTTGATHSCGATNVHNPSLTYGTMTDQEGNIYKTIVIGTQEWMAENLNTSIYRNGDAIPTGLSDAEWENTINTQQGSWAYFGNGSSYECPYGKLYNWYAAVDSRQLCPTGWHVPSDAEWSTMINFLDPTADGGNNVYNIAGIAMKSAGTIEGGNGYWFAYDTSAETTNSSGFSGLPAGYHDAGGGFANIFFNGNWWSCSQSNSYQAWSLGLNYYYPNAVRQSTHNQCGFSVRCLRD